MEVSVDRLKELLDGGEVQLVDVRDDSEHEAGHLPGDRHVHLDEVAGAADSFDQGRPLVFYCRSGNRSSMPADAFREAGYDAYNLAGGIVAWHEAGLPLEPEGGRVIDRAPLP
jgi:hydroxyacylglutathione hydrolase/adenylyltransferase/sulfurtransferase